MQAEKVILSQIFSLFSPVRVLLQTARVLLQAAQGLFQLDFVLLQAAQGLFQLDFVLFQAAQVLLQTARVLLQAAQVLLQAAFVMLLGKNRYLFTRLLYHSIVMSYVTGIVRARHAVPVRRVLIIAYIFCVLSSLLTSNIGYTGGRIGPGAKLAAANGADADPVLLFGLQTSDFIFAFADGGIANLNGQA